MSTEWQGPCSGGLNSLLARSGCRRYQVESAMSEIDITLLHASPSHSRTLGELLIEIVAHGGSVGFMHPLDPDAACAYWDDAP